MSRPEERPYASRGGSKLAAALDAFGISPAGWVCADLGCNVGGFVDCLLRRGAQKVYAVDTGYGALAYALRKDPRVVVMERTNAMHVELGEVASVLDNVVPDEEGGIRYHYVIIDYLACPTGGVLQPGTDVSDARWVGLSDLSALDITQKAGELVRRLLAAV